MARSTRSKSQGTVNKDTEAQELNLSPQEGEGTTMAKPQSHMDVSTVNWGAMLDGFKGDNSPVLFLKQRLRARLMPFSDPNKIFYPVDTFYRGKQRTKYLVKIQNLDDEDRPIRALLLTRTVVKSILSQAIEGWDLFSAENGHGIILVKSGTGKNTETQLSVSPKALPISEEMLKAAEELDMEKAAQEFSQRQADRSEEEEDPEGTSDGASESEEGWN